MALMPKTSDREWWASRGVTYTNREWRTLRRRALWIELKIRLANAWDELRGNR